MVFYTNFLIPKRFSAIVLGFVILIRPRQRGNKALIAHEKVHVRQFWRSWCLFPILYLLWPAKKLKYEAEAYGVSLLYATSFREKLNEYSYALSHKYNLNITQEEAESLIYQEWLKAKG